MSNCYEIYTDENGTLHARKKISLECVVCGFADQKGDIVDTVYGYAHQECLEDQDHCVCENAGWGRHGIDCSKFNDISHAGGVEL